MEKLWVKQYPAGVPADVRADLYPSLVALLEDSFKQYRDRPACRCMGRELSYGQVDDLSRALAAWLQGRGLVRGDRVAVMLPNLPQYLVAVAAVLRAGLVVVNVSPQHTPRELEYQLKDAGAKAIVIIENAAATLQQVLERLPVPHVLLTGAGDMLGPLKGPLVNHMARRVRKLVPSFQLPGATRFVDALARGRSMALQPATLGPDDIALLQYTGGTTGPCKGAVLLHRNLVANLLQSRAWYQPALARIPAGEQPVTVCALPLHHIYGFNVIMMLGLATGGCSLLVPNPRDTAALLKELARQRFHSFPAVDSLFDTLLPPAPEHRRRHGGAAGHRARLAGAHRLPHLRGLRPQRGQPVRHLQPGGHQRLERPHRPAAARHRSDAARRRGPARARRHAG